MSRHRNTRRLVASLVLASALACSPLCLAAPPLESRPPGTTTFNAADRMAITNLLSAFIDALDERNVDLLSQYQTPEFSAEYSFVGAPRVTIAGCDSFGAMIGKRFAYFDARGIGRRHVFSPPLFVEQTEDSARIVIQFLVTSSTHGQSWRPISSGRSEFGAVKTAGVWYFNSLVERTDGALDRPLEEIVPAQGMENASQMPVSVALEAAARGNAEALIEWIRQGGDPDQSDADGWTPLLIAAVRGNAQIVDVLLNNPLRQADPGKAFAPSGALPIHLAGHSGSVDTAARLLAARPGDLDQVWLLNGHTLLLQAAFYGHAKLAAFALARGANPAATTLRGLTAADFARQFDNQSLLRAVSAKEASAEEKARYYAALLERIREPVAPEQKDAQRRSNELVALIADSLKQAAREPDQVDALALAIAAKIDGTDVRRLGGGLRQPPLVVAVTGNDEQPNPQAAAQLRLRVVRLLLDRGASPLDYEKHPMGANAIIRASVFGHLDRLEAMGARISAAQLADALNERPAVNGLTALHDAVLRAGTANDARLPRYLKQIRWEVAHGARSDIEDFSGRTQRQYAQSLVDPDRRKMVLEALEPVR